MFCLGCGAEAPLRAVKCPVCGRDLGRNDGELQNTGSALPVFSPTASYAQYPKPVSAPLVAGNAGAVAGPTIQGLPRDAHGRAALVTVIAMAADLLVPWVVVNGTHRSIASVGAPALLALPVLGAALLPLLAPALRRNPAYAALPMIVGALCVGAGGVLWAVLTYLSYRLSVVAPAGTFPLQSPGPSAYGTFPDVGIYLFILGGAVLIFTGFHILLAAAGGVRTDAVPASFVAAPALLPSPPALPSLPPYLLAQSGAAISTYPAPASSVSIPLAVSASQPIPGAAMGYAMGYMNGQPSVSLTPTTQPAAPLGTPQGNVPTSLTPAPSDTTRQERAGAAARNGTSRVPLPGSAEWNEAPRQPEHMRPSLGWQRGPRVRR